MYPCIECNLEVRARQQAVQCDDCGKWQHRKCNSGVDQLTYRLAAITGRLDWRCAPCGGEVSGEESLDFIPQAESTRIIEDTAGK